jgi:hypothetical protein
MDLLLTTTMLTGRRRRSNRLSNSIMAQMMCSKKHLKGAPKKWKIKNC